MYIITYDTANKIYNDDYYFKNYTEAERFLQQKGFTKKGSMYIKSFNGWLSDTKALIKKMKQQPTGKYQIYLKVGGTMEQPYWTHEHIKTINAENPDLAIEKWLLEFNLTDESYIRKGKDGLGWSYYYSIICEEI